MKKVDIFGVDFAVTEYSEATQIIINNAQQRNSFAVFALPVHGVIENHTDQAFSGALECADMIVPDGQPIKWAMNYFYKTNLKDRVYGPVLVRWLLERANQKKLRIFLYGGSTWGVLHDFKDQIENQYPQLTICGFYREEHLSEDTMGASKINAAGAHIVLVGLGCPVQEKWIAKNKGQVNAVMIGVGAAFSFISGHTKMAPNWMQIKGLEWLYRLYREPGRLWKRYLYTNMYFSWLILKKFTKTIHSKAT